MLLFDNANYILVMRKKPDYTSMSWLPLEIEMFKKNIKLKKFTKTQNYFMHQCH